MLSFPSFPVKLLQNLDVMGLLAWLPLVYLALAPVVPSPVLGFTLEFVLLPWTLVEADMTAPERSLALLEEPQLYQIRVG